MKSDLCAYCEHPTLDHDARWDCRNPEPCLCKVGRPTEPKKTTSARHKGLGCAVVVTPPAVLAIASIWLGDWRFAGIAAVLGLAMVVVLMVFGAAVQESGR